LEVFDVVVVAVVGVVVVEKGVAALAGTDEVDKAALTLDADVRTLCNLGPRVNEDADDNLDVTLLSPFKAEEGVAEFIAG
jgi:hypothetical protein